MILARATWAGTKPALQPRDLGRYKSTRIEAKVRGRFHVIGDLTIKGITKEVTFDATEEGKEHWGFTAVLVINRKDFGLSWNVALEAGGWLVGEQVKVTIDLEYVNVALPADKILAVCSLLSVSVIEGGWFEWD